MSEVTTKDKPTNFSTDLEIVKSESKLHQSRSIIREFSLNTSMHGIAGISRSQSIHNRIFWSIAILIFTGMMFYFSIQAIRAYFKYPTEISVEFIEEWPQAFPAVTICNYSPLRYDQFIMPYLNY
ncbi:unnamed protein product, partial [Adineta steineri]